MYSGKKGYLSSGDVVSAIRALGIPAANYEILSTGVYRQQL